MSGGFAMQASGKRSLANVAAAILLAGVLVSATLILVPLSRSPTTITEVSVTATTQTTTSTQTITSTSTSVTTDYIPINGSGDSALLADCSPSQGRGYYAGTLTAGASYPAIICVQIYWLTPPPHSY
jgi:hypothetical protein